MAGNVDWNSIANQKSGGKKSDDIVFLNSKNLPQTFLPSPEIVMYEAIYDEATKRNRPPKADDEKAPRTQYLFYGLFLTAEGQKVVKICCCGQMVAKGISAVQKTLSNFGLISFVKVESTGSGLGTEYEVAAEKVTNKDIPLDIWKKDEIVAEVAKLPGLEDMRDRLLGLKTDEKSEVEAVAEVKAKNNFDLNI